MNFQPTVSEERWLALSRRLRGNPEAVRFAVQAGKWRIAALPSRCTFFFLGLVAAGMVAIIVRRLGSTDSVVVPAFVSLVMAEWLIVSRRHFQSGIEEALELAGLLMLAFECASRAGNSLSVGACLVGVAFAIAGLRLLNPLFTTLAVLALVLALRIPASVAGLLCYGTGAVALAAGAYRYRRPSHDRMLDYLVIAMPVAGYLWCASAYSLSSPADYLHLPVSRWLVPLGPLVFATVALATGLARRTRAPLIAFILSVTCTVYELRDLTGLPIAARLIIAGCVLLLVSMGLERYLLVPRFGITSRRLRDDAEGSSVVDVAGTAVLTSQLPGPRDSAFAGQGGRFGGGGASGDF